MGLPELGIAVVLLWLLRRREAPEGGGAVRPPKRLRPSKPSPRPGDAPVDLAPAEPAGEDTSLNVSPDCTEVVPGDGFWAWAQQRAAELVAQGYGLDPYPPELADRSLDAVLRTIVAEATGHAECVNAAPWLDRWVKAHPPPKPAPGETREAYLARLDAWDDAWDALMASWAASHQQLYDVLRQLGAMVTALRRGELGAAPQGGQVEALPKGATQADAAKLAALGYDVTDATALVFQMDYNRVRDYLTGGAWSSQGLAILEDGIVGPQTRAALEDALRLAGGDPARWWDIIAQAAEAGY